MIRPSRGHGVIRESRGDHCPIVGVSDLDSAQRHHPAEDGRSFALNCGIVSMRSRRGIPCSPRA